jgi:hypothetical protein
MRPGSPRGLVSHGGLVAHAAWYPMRPGSPRGLVSHAAWYPMRPGIPCGLVSHRACARARACVRTCSIQRGAQAPVMRVRVPKRPMRFLRRVTGTSTQAPTLRRPSSWQARGRPLAAPCRRTAQYCTTWHTTDSGDAMQCNAACHTVRTRSVAGVWALNDKLRSRGAFVCPTDCSCDQLTACGIPYIH